MLQKITSGWLGREDLGEGLAFALALKSRQDLVTWNEEGKELQMRSSGNPRSWDVLLCRPDGGLGAQGKAS